jgi:hypothetical protein
LFADNSAQILLLQAFLEATALAKVVSSMKRMLKRSSMPPSVPSHLRKTTRTPINLFFSRSAIKHRCPSPSLRRFHQTSSPSTFSLWNTACTVVIKLEPAPALSDMDRSRRFMPYFRCSRSPFLLTHHSVTPGMRLSIPSWHSRR